MVDFINEVEEELRKDKYNELLRKFGPLIIAVIIGIVSIAGYIEFQKFSKSKKARATAASYTQAAKLAEDGDLQAAIDKFVAISKVSPDGYAGLSLSRAAGLKVQLGDLDGAVVLFDGSSAAFLAPIHKDLSSLKAGYILMEQGRYDEVKTRMSTLAIDGAPYRDLAKELLAHAYVETEELESARSEFTYLANAPGVLTGVQSRAKQAMMLMNADVAIAPLDVNIQELPAPTPDAPSESMESPVEKPQAETQKD